MAVQFFSHSTRASSAFVLPTLVRCVSSQRSPACAWLSSEPATGPSECFEHTTSLSSLIAAMKMMQPFDLSVSV